MADLAQAYAVTSKEIADIVSNLSEEDLARPVPATPLWSIGEVIAHMTGVAECVAAGDFPKEFFMAIGSEQGIAHLDEWTERHVELRRGVPLHQLLDRWESGRTAITPMLRGDEPWPGDVMPFAGYVLVTDVAVHQQDINGALGIVKDRDGEQIRIGFRAYVAGVDLRIQASGGPSIRFATEYKDIVAGGGEPQATVRGTRFELFRALSGRRSPDQIRAYEWDGDPEPFIEFFYPYGVREKALVE